MKSAAVILCLVLSTIANGQMGSPQVIMEDWAKGGFPFDWDMDGDLDILISPQPEQASSLANGYWYENEGGGSFSARELAFPWFSMGGGMVAVDLDGDGDLDLINDKMQVLLCDGPGQYHIGDNYIHSSGPAFDRSNLADADGDGDLDLVFADGLSNGAFDYYSNDGTGHFTEVPNLLPSNGGLHGCAFADMDGDGDVDIVNIGNTLYGSADWYPNDGTGHFGTVIHTGVHCQATGTADLNGDGAADLLCLVKNEDQGDYEARVYYNSGDGSFSSFQLLAAGLRLTSSFNMTRQYVAFADLDNDGDLDITVGSKENVTTLLNLGNEQWSVTNTPLAIYPSSADRMWFGDMDDDGDLDLLVRTVGGMLLLFRNDGSGSWSEPELIDGALNWNLKLADLNGDGRLDVINYGNLGGYLGFYSAALITWLPNNGTSSFGNGHVLYSADADQGIKDLICRDMDLDGDTDLVFLRQPSPAIVSWMQNDGTGNFGPPMDLATMQHGENISVDDLNGDGLPDVLLAGGWNSEPVIYCANLGNGVFDTSQMAFQPPYLHKVRSARTGDMDGDGDNDLIISYDVSNVHSLFWMANDGDGVFSGSHPIQPEKAFAPFSIADVDDDGDMDVLYGWADGVDDRAYVSLNNGNGTFQPGMALNANDDRFKIGRGCVDLDMDGRSDIIGGSGAWSSAMNVFRGQGAGVFNPPVPLTADSVGLQDGAAADMDGDGVPDLVHLLAPSGHRTLIWQRNFAGGHMHIDGSVFHDVNQNGIKDPGEGGLGYFPLLISPTTVLQLSNADGAFSYAAVPGTYTLTAEVPGPYWSITTTPASYSVTLDSANPVSTGNDIGLAQTVDTVIAVPSLAHGNSACASIMQVSMHLLSQGSVPLTGHCELAFDTLFTLLPPYGDAVDITETSVLWALDTVMVGSQWARTIGLHTPSAEHIGDSTLLRLTCYVSDLQGGGQDTLIIDGSYVIACSFDPNVKVVVPAGTGEPGAIPPDTKELTYTIHFQNTGTAPAQNVLIRDALSTDLQWHSLQVLAASHTLTELNVDQGGIAQFRFAGINLPDSGADYLGSQGFVTYRIALNDGLPLGTTIQNSADIYFDLNVPVVTAATTNTLVDCSNYSAVITWLGDALGAGPGTSYQWYLNGLAIAGATEQEYLFLANGSYTVRVTSADGCAAISEAYVVINTQITSSQEREQVLVVPDPMNDQATLLLNRPLSISGRVLIHDARGRLVRTVSGNGSDRVLIRRLDLTAGIYTLQVVDGNGVRGYCRMTVL